MLSLKLAKLRKPCLGEIPAGIFRQKPPEKVDRGPLPVLMVNKKLRRGDFLHKAREVLKTDAFRDLPLYIMTLKEKKSCGPPEGVP
jgi:hypothetical protein